MKISPSIASANQLRLEEEIQKLEGRYDDFHIDIEDGNFIPNITFGMKTIKALRTLTGTPFSFHLMVTNPYDYLDDISMLNPSIVFVHAESVHYFRDFITFAKRKGIPCGIAFNPVTSIEPYLYIMKDLDAVMIMTSEPDGLGQVFIEEMLGKVKTIRFQYPSLGIWVDGGVQIERLKELDRIGVTTTVLGRAIFGK